MTSDAQDRIVKQLEDRYPMMDCTPLDDGSLKIHCRRTGIGSVLWERNLVVGADGKIIRDSEEQDTDSFEDFTEEAAHGDS